MGEKITDREVLPSSEFVTELYRNMRELTPTEMAHHATAKVHLPATLQEADLVYVRTDSVRPPLVRPYTGPFRILEKYPKYFKIDKNGKPDNVSIDRLKPAFIFDNNIAEKPKKITQPRAQKSRVPETDEVAAETTEIAPRDYRAALLRDPPRACHDEERPKRTYVKRKNELRSEEISTRKGRISRPPRRF